MSDPKMRVWNNIWKCAKCEDVFAGLSEEMHIVSIVARIIPSPSGMQVENVPVPICTKCYKDLKLSDSPPPKLHRVPPGANLRKEV